MTSKSNVLLIGSGAVGTIAALNLELGGEASVTALLRSNYSTVRENGFTIRSCDHGSFNNWRPSKLIQSVPQESTLERPYDYIVVTTKNIPDCGSSIVSQVASAVTPGVAAIVLIQNGLNIEKQWFKQFPTNVVLSGISLIGSREKEHGIIDHMATDVLSIGAFRNVNIEVEKEIASAKEFIRLYSAAGKAACTLTTDVVMDRWRKLVYNATINPLCAITGLDSDDLQLAGESLSTLIRPAMKEIVAAAAASGKQLPEDIVETMIGEDPIGMHFVPSMLQDVRKLNLIEHETIVGEALAEGTRFGVPMPTISILYNLCKVLQWRISQQRNRDVSQPSG